MSIFVRWLCALISPSYLRNGDTHMTICQVWGIVYIVILHNTMCICQVYYYKTKGGGVKLT